MKVALFVLWLEIIMDFVCVDGTTIIDFFTIPTNNSFPNFKI
jgi:hypothetical protein